MKHTTRITINHHSLPPEYKLTLINKLTLLYPLSSTTHYYLIVLIHALTSATTNITYYEIGRFFYKLFKCIKNNKVEDRVYINANQYLTETDMQILSNLIEFHDLTTEQNQANIQN
jgi:hypothetical protein